MSAPALAVDLLTAIEGADPCGPDLRYQPLYDKVRQLRRQDSGGLVADQEQKKADHKAVVALISDALATQTKDLQLAVWLTDSLIHREGFAGLRRGIDLIRGLIENFWEGVHPRPEDPGDYEFRVAALDWLDSDPTIVRETYPIMSVRLAPITEGGLSWQHYEDKSHSDAPPAKVEEFEKAFQETKKEFFKQRSAQLEGCREAIAALRTLCDERLGRDAPSFRRLTEVVEDVHRTVRGLLARKLEIDPDPVEAQAVAQPEPVPAVRAPVVVAQETFTGAAEPAAIEPADVRDAIVRIVAAARHLRRVQPANPAGYLISRALRWGELRAGGAEAVAAALPAPGPEVRLGLRTLAAAERWGELLELAETAAASEAGRAWLDPHRYAVLACEKLGYTNAAAAIRSELATLLQEYPQIVSATLMDDTGAANPDTVAWLATVRNRS